MIIAIRYADVIRDFPGFSDRIKVIETLEALWNIEHSYPPLFHLSAVALSLSLGNAQDVLAMSNIIFLAVLLFSVFKIGERLFDARVGLFAAFLSGLSPMLAGASRMFLPEFSAAAMISLGIYLLLLTENFGSRKYSLLFGLGAGLGMLTRETFLIFLIGPTIYIIYKAFFEANLEKHQKLINLVISLALGSIIWMPYYLKNIAYYFMDYRKWCIRYWSRILLLNVHRFRSHEVIISILIFLLIVILISRTKKFRTRGYTKILVWFFIFILAGFCWSDKKVILKLTWYALNLKDQIGLPFLIVFLLCLPYFLRSGKNKGFLLSWIIVPYCFFTITFFPNDFLYWQSRFTIAYLPAIALISASRIINIKIKTARLTVIFVILILSIIHFFNISFGLPFTANSKNKFIRFFSNPQPTNWWLMHRPVKDNYWKTAEILSWMRQDNHKELALISLLVDTGEINRETFSYYITAGDLPFEVVMDNTEDLSKSDYLITLLHKEDWHWEVQKKIILELQDRFKKIEDGFVLVNKFDKLDNTLYIYKKKAIIELIK
jgi:hypothetical protein